MSDNVKLIIEIDKEIYKEAIRSGYSYQYDEIVANAVADGIPLDDVKDIIRDKKAAETDVAREYYNLGLGDAINILDYVGKAESRE